MLVRRGAEQNVVDLASLAESWRVLQSCLVLQCSVDQTAGLLLEELQPGLSATEIGNSNRDSLLEKMLLWHFDAVQPLEIFRY